MRLAIVSGLGMLGGLALGGAGAIVEPSLPEGSGKAQIMQACSACHTVAQMTSHRQSTPQWADTVDQMIARGAQVSDEDYTIIVAYLGKNFGPVPRRAVAPPQGM